MNSTTLYGKGTFGINIWSIGAKGDTIHIRANGTNYISKVEVNNSGRGIHEQVQLEMNARITKKLNHGFKRSKEELSDIVTNQLGLASPMLAKPFKIDMNVNGYYQQVKLDGHRCLVSKDGAYSRGGKEINTIPEIVDSLDIPEGAIFDGELYKHGVPLQTIASWAKRRQPDTLKLRYFVYDIIIPGMPYTERRELLKELNLTSEYVQIVVSAEMADRIDPFSHCMGYKSHGFEGAILRKPDGVYEPGKRSSGLLKVKMRFDAEYRCIDINPSKEGWGVLTLETRSGETFDTSAPGNHTEKKYCIDNKEKFIGQYVTCEYADLTNRGVPFHCVAIRWLVNL